MQGLETIGAMQRNAEIGSLQLPQEIGSLSALQLPKYDIQPKVFQLRPLVSSSWWRATGLADGMENVQQVQCTNVKLPL
jgi:hypothetical protein